jgi:hypothetical protein
MQAIRPDNRVSLKQKQGCIEVSSNSRHWPCLFPQHGPGKKHARKIELADWQQLIVEQYLGDCSSAGSRWTGSGWSGGFRSRTRSPWRSGTR